MKFRSVFFFIRPWSGKRSDRLLICAVSLCGILLASGSLWAINILAPPSLKTVPVPEPPNLGLFLKASADVNPEGFPIPLPEARAAAIALGKALFWDMQVGSDGIQACASCHFHAGADNRTKNVVNPGFDSTFQSVPSTNSTVTAGHFPFTKFQDPEDRALGLVTNINDILSSPGIHRTDFNGLAPSGPVELGTLVPDPVFNVNGINTRRVEPRNSPTVINAVFNFSNFWDGRANNVFNGVNPFGEADPNAVVFVNDVNLQPQRVSIPNASLASQAVGPPGSDFEMSFAGRSFPNIGKKLLTLKPLAKQRVHRHDSVLAPYANLQGNGLNTTYAELIRAAFQDKYWNSTQIVSFSQDGPQVVTVQGREQVIGAGTPTVLRSEPANALAPNRSARVEVANALGPNEFTQMEANFSLFFGLAVQLYEATLVSDDSPFDRFQEGNNGAMSPDAQAGLNIFITQAGNPQTPGGSCINCHVGSEFTAASVNVIGAEVPGDPGEPPKPPEGLVESMVMGDGLFAFYDLGFYNIGVRPPEEDIGRGGTDPFGNPLSFTRRALLADNGDTNPLFRPPLNPLLPCGEATTPCPQQRAAVRAAFKTPTLRNVELTGPYFHNGEAATLRQAVDFYVRGGNFPELNMDDLDPEIMILAELLGNQVAQRQLIEFLLALTDERVRQEKAPFDHPELFIPNGAQGDAASVTNCSGKSCDNMIRIPAVGKNGLSAEKRLPIGTFLKLDQR